MDGDAPVLPPRHRREFDQYETFDLNALVADKGLSFAIVHGDIDANCDFHFDLRQTVTVASLGAHEGNPKVFNAPVVVCRHIDRRNDITGVDPADGLRERYDLRIAYRPKGRKDRRLRRVDADVVFASREGIRPWGWTHGQGLVEVSYRIPRGFH